MLDDLIFKTAIKKLPLIEDNRKIILDCYYHVLRIMFSYWSFF